MDTLPPELIRAIVEEIDDDESLKMCSLVGTLFREPSQRLLLHELTLGTEEGGDKPYTAAYALFLESPHVVPYFTRLNCSVLTADAEPTDVEALCGVLENLTNIRQCYLVRGTDEMQPWSEISSLVSQAITKFFSQQRLSHLHVISIGMLPKYVLAHFLCAAPTVSFVEASVEVSSDAPTHPLYAPPVQNLLLLSSPTVAEVLTALELRPFVANIRKLWTEPDIEFGYSLISTVASQLQHLRIQCASPIS